MQLEEENERKNDIFYLLSHASKTNKYKYQLEVIEKR